MRKNKQDILKKPRREQTCDFGEQSGFYQILFLWKEFFLIFLGKYPFRIEFLLMNNVFCYNFFNFISVTEIFDFLHFNLFKRRTFLLLLIFPNECTSSFTIYTKCAQMRAKISPETMLPSL